jgi:beta-lactamase regulating signal transducer with metallopeptidase domain
MLDIWGFLLQTLTVSGVAVLILIIKSLLKDKLPPKWHFAVWSILGIIILLPTGLFGNYVLFNWQTVLNFFKILLKDYSNTRVLYPFPVIKDVPHTFAEWLFFIYAVGVIISFSIYILSYIRLRIVLRKSKSPDIETFSAINTIGHKYGIKPCRITVVPNLPSAFVCGILSPVLVIPEKQIDEKVILHELFHLKNRDTFWSMLVCCLRCLHWCNPLINYCTHLAINDMESRCDQFVLEQLEGEERRDYGRILLSMSNEQFARTPGSTSINNGGKNISKRIEAIARFKNYPIGMSLASVCVIIALGCSLVVGVQATDVPDSYKNNIWSFARAKSSNCTTYVGAFDTYAKSVMTESRAYRIICAPEKLQAELIESNDNKWDCGFYGNVDSSENYYIFNLENPEKDVYEGIIVIKLSDAPDNMEKTERTSYLTYQKIRVYKENGRWVAIPLDKLNYVETKNNLGRYGCMDVPAIKYTYETSGYRLDIGFQTIYAVDNKIENNDAFASILGSYSYSTVPVLNAKFSEAYDNQETVLTHLGLKEEREQVKRVGVSIMPVFPGQERPQELTPAVGCDIVSSSSSDGTSYAIKKTDYDWGPELYLSGGGGGGTFSQLLNVERPEYYVADLYINNELYAQMELHLQEE